MEAFDFGSAKGASGPVADAAAAAVAAAAPRAALVLGAMLRRTVEASASGPVNLLPVEGAEGDSTWFSMTCSPGGSVAAGVAAVPTAAVMALSDALMGGPGLADDREPTLLEERLVATRLTRALAPVAEALQPFGVTCLDLLPTLGETTPVGPGLVAFDVAFALAPPPWSLDGATEIVVTIALPGSFFAHADRAAAGPSTTVPELDAALRNVPLEVDVRFAPLSLAVDDLDELAVGDVIRLDHPTGEPVRGEVDGRPLFLARLGRAGRNLAVEIVGVFEETSA